MSTERVYKDFVNGHLTITNVPYTPYKDGMGADGETEYLKSSVLMQVLELQQYMLKNNITEMDYYEEL